MGRRSGRAILIGAIALTALIGGAFGTWLWRHGQEVGQKETKNVDMDAALEANNRGIGLLEQYEFSKALEAFEELHALAPSWLTGRINLGIALMNEALGDSAEDSRDSLNRRAMELFEGVLKEQPKNPYANYCLGLIWFNQFSDSDKAAGYFKIVTEVDPDDAVAWFRYAMATIDDHPIQAQQYLDNAMRLDPYLLGVIQHQQQQLRRRGLEAEADQLSRRMESLREAEWATPFGDIYYVDRGKYHLLIAADREVSKPKHGPIPKFKQEATRVVLAEGARWAAGKDFGEGPATDLRRLFRQRFSGTMVVLDYNRDGKPDLFLLGAVVEDNKVRDLLLRNDGDGRFTDVTREAGLGGNRPSLGCCVADFDNDSFPDIWITGIGEQHLFRNDGRGHFADVTREAGLDEIRGVCLGSAFVDIDQDGDLDLLVAQYGATVEDALQAVRSNKPVPGSRVLLYLNVGVAPPQNDRGTDPSPLSARFRASNQLEKVLDQALLPINITIGDFDQDRDLDALVVADGAASLSFIVNDRLLQFHKTELSTFLPRQQKLNGALVLDAIHKERSDLLLIGPDHEPALLLAKKVAGELKADKWFETGRVKSPALMQAVAIDLDLDGWTDVIGLSKEGKPLFLHNEVGQLVHVPDVLGKEERQIGMAAADFRGKAIPDVILWSEKKGLTLLANQGNGNHALLVQVTGHRRLEPTGSLVRCNADGIGTWIIAQTRDRRTAAEIATPSAGMGQSRQATFLGLGTHDRPDLVLLRWPDMCWQAELNVPGDSFFSINETNRKTTSCPILFTWNGKRFVFVTDFLGAGSIGECEPKGTHRRPRPEESIKIEANQLQPQNGQLIMKLAEPMNETTYLDRLRLLVIDHPGDMRVYPDERFPDGNGDPSEKLLAFKQEIFAAKAIDHRERDVTNKLRHWDRVFVSDFAKRSWIGLAEDHWVELNFGDRLSSFTEQHQLILCLAGWTDYPYPESIWAAEQAGIAVQPPVLERRTDDGKWESLGEASFPAGLPRMMTLNVTGKLIGGSCILRLRTNMQVYWDQIFVAQVIESEGADALTNATKEKKSFHVTPLAVSAATLAPKPCMLEYSPDGKEPTIFDYDRTGDQLTSRQSGFLTRFGEVTDLLNEVDDCFVVFGAGDELDVRFDASRLPDLPKGWKRSYVLRSWGYCKDISPFTALGETIGPLPFKAMKNYPYGRDEHYPSDAKHLDYLRKYNTRFISGNS
ncbi:MAG: FG-GAP-like repeat-containing protein [Gemmataceae bacterium]